MRNFTLTALALILSSQLNACSCSGDPVDTSPPEGDTDTDTDADTDSDADADADSDADADADSDADADADADSDADVDTGTIEDRDGTYMGDFQLDGSGLEGMVTDSCVGTVELMVVEADDPMIKGQGCCQFVGMLAGPPFYLTDTYCGDLEGNITTDPLCEGQLVADMGFDVITDDWAGQFSGLVLTGSFEGEQLIVVKGFEVDLSYAGAFEAERQ